MQLHQRLRDHCPCNSSLEVAPWSSEGVSWSSRSPSSVPSVLQRSPADFPFHMASSSSIYSSFEATFMGEGFCSSSNRWAHQGDRSLISCPLTPDYKEFPGHISWSSSFEMTPRSSEGISSLVESGPLRPPRKKISLILSHNVAPWTHQCCNDFPVYDMAWSSLPLAMRLLIASSGVIAWSNTSPHFLARPGRNSHGF
eukprot:Gb_12839 [translate_table: standard]